VIRECAVIAFWLLTGWGIYYAGFRWNDSDEAFLHRGGLCTHSKSFCGPRDEKAPES
jgi:hypothetical protein